MNTISSIETSILSVFNGLESVIDPDTNKTTLFNHFSVQNVTAPILQEEEDYTKFEARFFWPFSHLPEVYDLSHFIFDPQYYKHKITSDKYIISKNDLNIKIRKNELHFKALLKRIGNIYQYNKKKKIEFPLNGAIINSFLNEPILPDAAILTGPEDFSALPGIVSVDVLKERYVRKLENRTKIEFGVIELNGQRWKTICFESECLRTVMLLSLLVNQKGAEALGYEAFLGKYA